jgi:hypothetical protein
MFYSILCEISHRYNCRDVLQRYMRLGSSRYLRCCDPRSIITTNHTRRKTRLGSGVSSGRYLIGGTVLEMASLHHLIGTMWMVPQFRWNGFRIWITLQASMFVREADIINNIVDLLLIEQTWSSSSYWSGSLGYVIDLCKLNYTPICEKSKLTNSFLMFGKYLII